jgi:DNA-binding CsgD family transcriptional regulator
MNLVKNFSKNTLLLSLSIIITICVLIFNVFYFSIYYGFVQVNYINSLFLVPFIVLILSFGVILGRSKQSKKISNEVDNIFTEREKEIVQLIVEGKKNIEIANALFVELSTIKSHINNIYKKVNVKNRKEIREKYWYFNK